MWALRHKNRRYTLTKSSISIGQGRECDVVIQVSVRNGLREGLRASKVVFVWIKRPQLSQISLTSQFTIPLMLTNPLTSRNFNVLYGHDAFDVLRFILGL